MSLTDSVDIEFFKTLTTKLYIMKLHTIISILAAIVLFIFAPILVFIIIPAYAIYMFLTKKI